MDTTLNNPEVLWIPVYNVEGFLIGVYKKDGSDHHHEWTLEGEKNGRCLACGLFIKVYTFKEAMELTNGSQKLP